MATNRKDAASLIGELVRDLDIASDHLDVVQAQYKYLYSKLQEVADSIDIGDIRKLPDSMPTMRQEQPTAYPTAYPSAYPAPINHNPQYNNYPGNNVIRPMHQLQTHMSMQPQSQVYYDNNGPYIVDHNGYRIPCDQYGNPIAMTTGSGSTRMAPNPNVMMKKKQI